MNCNSFDLHCGLVGSGLNLHRGFMGACPPNLHHERGMLPKVLCVHGKTCEMKPSSHHSPVLHGSPAAAPYTSAGPPSHSQPASDPALRPPRKPRWRQAAPAPPACSAAAPSPGVMESVQTRRPAACIAKRSLQHDSTKHTRSPTQSRAK